MMRAAPDSKKPKRRIDAKPERWQALRDDLHTLAIENGNKWIELAKRSDVVPDGVNGRDFELWQPILALASWFDDHGERGLLDRMQKHALSVIDNAREDAVPDTDEVLLEILAEKVKEGQAPTPGEILAEAFVRDSASFAKWSPRGISARLGNYGLKARKIDRRRSYRFVTVAELRRIQTNYSVDLGIENDTPTPSPKTPSQPSRTSPEMRAGRSKDAVRDGVWDGIRGGGESRKHRKLRGENDSRDGRDANSKGRGEGKKKRRHSGTSDSSDSSDRPEHRPTVPSQNGQTRMFDEDGNLADGWTETLI
jgi:hypothetical protein